MQPRYHPRVLHSVTPQLVVNAGIHALQRAELLAEAFELPVE